MKPEGLSHGGQERRGETWSNEPHKRPEGRRRAVG